MIKLTTREFDPQSVGFGVAKPNQHGAPKVPALYEKDGREYKQTFIQTPWLYNPFGLNKSLTQAGEEPKYSVELSFGNAPSSYVELFHDKMKGFDTRITTAVKDNQREWFSRADIDDDHIEAFYKPIVRQYKNKEKVATGEFPDTMRFKVDHFVNAENGTVSFQDLEVYNMKQEQIPIASIEDMAKALGKGNRIRALAQLTSIWQIGNEFGFTLRTKRFQVYSMDNGLGEDCAFEMGSDGENSGLPEPMETNSDEEEEL